MYVPYGGDVIATATGECVRIFPDWIYVYFGQFDGLGLRLI